MIPNSVKAKPSLGERGAFLAVCAVLTLFGIAMIYSAGIV